MKIKQFLVFTVIFERKDLKNLITKIRKIESVI